MKPLLISSGEPAGVGPELCLTLAEQDIPVVILGDKKLLQQRAEELKLKIQITDYKAGLEHRRGQLAVVSVSCPHPVNAGTLNPLNASYVIELLTQAAQRCQQGDFSGLVTAPVHKANINAAGIEFTGHTEFFSQFYQTEVVMMLACAEMKVALVTTHLPLSKVAQSITFPLVIKVLEQVHLSLIKDFGIEHPIIKVAGLNPHAGESGYLGREEIETITPALNHLRSQGMNLEGPLPADTMFNKSKCDAYVAMYHDQGLPVLKYVGFHHAVNVTLGLPIIRTSVDHGTALELAGTGRADAGSLLAAVNLASRMAENRMSK